MPLEYASRSRSGDGSAPNATTPSGEALAKAERVIALFAANHGAGVIGLDGEMLDRPHLRQAERLVARARKLVE